MSDFRGLLPLMCVVCGFVALATLSFMHLDQQQLERLMFGMVIIGFVCFLGYVLWSGKFPFGRNVSVVLIRKNDPISYWIAITIAAIFVGFFVVMTIVRS